MRPPEVERASLLFLLDRCRAYDSATRSLSGVIICPGNRDSGYTANSIAFSISMILPTVWKSTRPRESLARADNLASLIWNATPFLIPLRAAWVRWAGRHASRRNGSGRERNDRRGSEVGGRAMRTFPLRVRGKCAGGPYCRTLCNARTGRTPRERPRHRIANRNSGNAKGAAA